MYAIKLVKPVLYTEGKYGIIPFGKFARLQLVTTSANIDNHGYLQVWVSDLVSVSITAYYNMVGVAVAIVIPTMHEKSCIDLHNAR